MSWIKDVVMLTVLAVWVVVVSASIYNYVVNAGPLPDPILLGIPSATWLALHPPLPRSVKKEEKQNGT